MLAVARSFVLLAFAFAAGNTTLLAQSTEDVRYEEDYNRLMDIVNKVPDPAKRAEQMVAYYKGRPNLDERLKPFADSNFGNTLQALLKQPDLVKKFAQSVLALRPKCGEAWFFLGVVLKNESQLDRAIEAFAKSSLIENSRQVQGQQLLDTTYRTAHKGSMVGKDKLISKIKAELK